MRSSHHHKISRVSVLQDEDEKLLQEMQGVKAQAEQRQKRDKKRRIESKKKARIRAAQLAMGEFFAFIRLSTSVLSCGTSSR